MATFLAFNDLVSNFLSYLRMVQPNLDTKPGTVSRDLFIDSPSQGIANLYTQLRNIAGLQSFFSISGSDLDHLASNFNATRGTGNNSAGVAVFTTNVLTADIAIPAGTVVIANNGISFQVVNNFVMRAASSSTYKATASRLSTQLALASITDQYAAEINMEALTSGTSGNIGVYSLTTTNVTGISNVTNLQAFLGGTDPESDSAFLSRILSIFAGSNTGTSLGYTTTVDAITGVSASIVVGPGDPLMTRDGTQTTTESNGTIVIVSAGSGGMVDIYVLGSNLTSQVDSFIYVDKSGRNDPTDPSNVFILGQQGQSTTTNAAQRRVTLISENELPFQPVSGILSVAGSSSGANFAEQYTNSAGQLVGNYALVHDTGAYAGSPFGFDKLEWTSNTVDLPGESITRGTFNGSDQLQFSDVESIVNAYQNILVTNENPTVNSATRSTITLKHTPVSSVNSVSNLTTGENYVIVNQNPDGTSGTPNTDGNITISGSTLPVSTDVLQVGYTWTKHYDSFLDYDNLLIYNPDRTVQDSIDWSYSNLVQGEPAIVGADGYEVTVTHPISKVLSVRTFLTTTSTASSGAVTVPVAAQNVVDIRRISDGAELYNTDAHNGIISGTYLISLPSDTMAENGDIVSVIYNTTNLFNKDGYAQGTFESNIISLPSGVTTGGVKVLVDYVANINVLIPETNLDVLPILGDQNTFVIDGDLDGYQPTSYIYNTHGAIVQDLRRAPSNLILDVESTVASGSISVLGTTVKKVSAALVVVTSGNGYTIDLQSAILKDLGVTTLPSSISVSKVESVRGVTASNAGNITVNTVYDIVNYELANNQYDGYVALKNSSLSAVQMSLPPTPINTNALLSTGDVVQVTFYYINTSGNELIYFSANGQQITNNEFLYVDRVYVSSGFKDPSGSMSGTITVSNMNQPASNTSYSVDYDYVAPQEGERITITYDYNALIGAATLAVETVRPITADVLIKQAKPVSINVSVSVVVDPNYVAQTQTVTQDANNAITTFLNASSLGTTAYASGVITALAAVSGINGVTITNFSSGNSGNVQSITAQANEYLIAGAVGIVIKTASGYLSPE
jgi:hypothetical protein